MIPPPQSPNASLQTTCDNADSVLAQYLVSLSQTNPALARVIRAWDRLPEAVRRGILAIIRTVTET